MSDLFYAPILCLNVTLTTTEIENKLLIKLVIFLSCDIADEPKSCGKPVHIKILNSSLIFIFVSFLVVAMTRNYFITTNHVHPLFDQHNVSKPTWHNMSKPI